MNRLTKLYPMVQFKKDTWEIDEFDCASMFLLIGTEKALLIDCGMGIGDLAGAVRMLTDKPLTVVLSHNHPDHTGNAYQFREVWLSPLDREIPIPLSAEFRKNDIVQIARRQKRCLGAPYTMFPLYPFDLDEDVRDPGPEDEAPVLRSLEDGQEFDLGGGRVVTTFSCPGHTKGEMVFLDSMTGSLFAGDAVNYNLGVGAVPLETTLRAMKRIRDMGSRYDGIWNGHHDFRALGAPLGEDCLPTVIRMMEDACAGHIVPCEDPSFWGQDIPLRRGQTVENMFAGLPGMPREKRVTLRCSRNWLTVNPDRIRE